MADDISAGEGDIAVALSFEGVVEDLKHPRKTFESISKWAKSVGIVSEKPTTVINSFCAKRKIDIDFFSGPEGGKLDGLQRVPQWINCDRHIYIGATKRDEVIAEKAGWEYIDIKEAAERTGWELDRD
ncbi:MAG: hypothetical protein SV377_04210 [Halobacteria archaeon]|nr:hypothetical protein [Halobacteria archaeon]